MRKSWRYQVADVLLVREAAAHVVYIDRATRQQYCARHSRISGSALVLLQELQLQATESRAGGGGGRLRYSSGTRQDALGVRHSASRSISGATGFAPAAPSFTSAPGKWSEIRCARMWTCRVASTNTRTCTVLVLHASKI